MNSERWFCFVDVKFYEEDSYVERHFKAIYWVTSFDEAMEEIKEYIGNDFISISFEWARKDCKTEPVFTENEFDRFETIRHFLEDDKSYEDYKKIAEAEKNERSRKN